MSFEEPQEKRAFELSYNKSYFFGLFKKSFWASGSYADVEEQRRKFEGEK